MSDVVEKMSEHVPESFMRLHIFLAAIMTIPALYHGTAIKAVFLRSQRCVAHFNFFLKILKKLH